MPPRPPPGFHERRRGDRRVLQFSESPGWIGSAGLRPASWAEMRVQFLTRFLFVSIALFYFSGRPGEQPFWYPVWAVWLHVGSYWLLNAVNMWHAWLGRYGESRIRLAMVLDVASISLFLVNDPYSVPPSLLAYLMVILGNGMRYGLRMYGESLAWSFGCALLALVVRYQDSLTDLRAGLIFLPLFSAIIVMYAYFLLLRLEQARVQLERVSRYDGLTGLLNRRGLAESVELLQRLMDRDTDRITVVFADMDRFKSVNDTLGHTAGDAVLQEIGRILREGVRRSDLIARYGGDEFVFVLPHTGREQALQVTGRVERRIHELSRRTGIDFGITFGMGETGAGHRADVLELIDAVDREMYEAKRARRQQRETTLRADAAPAWDTPAAGGG
ncbi:GGDEF domain-containing protein [Plasticicumulans sp.]|uniref:GGDEF domain-containing protein n=1 Tax=Plasticicumulans sp. TaxID=2307179 RepID=UPI002C97FC6F|nr:GGDEF domain-containing protein [Plasticicumulans sp.]MBS0602991.1 GGDEF domain-containing protein [Pseudomonadota bacterium]HMW30604.1 GGDEF domain-containing protein [Plasticicumulans sp.]HMX52915.1 GGDEF domain-containing protein [Plasticicumulans sp.]HNB89100.1 GGDEF domain-containing protein [Plasticicumulans sp.]HNF64714.1 GGDEF domain-containing protein [Plasticicumulans sp.]